MGENNRFIAFLCPQCRQTVLAERGAFQLAAAPSRIPCPCGKSAVTIRPGEQGSAVTVPCLSCGREHTVTCSTRSLLEQRCLAFSCGASGLNCCFIGEEGAVTAAARRLEQTLDALPEKEERGAFLNQVIMEEVLSELKDIAQRDGVSCTCGGHIWNLRVNYSSVDLTCAQCGGVLRLDAATGEDLEDLCCRDALQIHGKDVPPGAA
ncbi:MAG: hypothetical protein LUE91_05620 [Oscillospiraceae bacterium]|nr:hypothetical protein [Oscillospiraceae bacterium]